MKLFHAVTILFLLLVSISSAELAITVYNDNLGLVRESREFDFPKGVGEIRFVDVAAQIIPTSVHFSCDRAILLEQNYEFDLVDPYKLMKKYIDHEIELITEDGRFTGTLLSADGGAVIRESDNTIRSIGKDRIVNVHFSQLPEGLITRPTLVWTTESKKGGKGNAEMSYLTNGMRWEAEYVAVTDKIDENLELAGWVNINNHSGATYKEAQIKLMAGDVKIERKGRGAYEGMEISPEGRIHSRKDQFKEQEFYEYHLYTLQRASTLRDNQMKQISLFPTAKTPIEKEYRYEPYMGKKVKVSLEFKNEKKNGLGMPLPKGLVRVYKEGPDGGLEFVGEDRIDHTPTDETVRISTGNAFDVVGERTQVDRKRRGNDWDTEYLIKIRNRKRKEAVTVTVAESFWGDWELLDSTTDGWVKNSASNVEWKVHVKPGEEKEVKYRVLVRN